MSLILPIARCLLVAGLSGALTLTGWAQQNRRIRLDSLYNEPFRYSTVSALLLPRGFFEINNVSAMQTATGVFNDQFEPEPLNARAAAFTNLLQFTCGLADDSRFNLGVDVLYTNLRLDLNPDSSPWKVFSRDSALVRSQGLSSVGLRFRWKPLALNRQLVVQGQVNKPVGQAQGDPVNMQVQAIYVIELNRRTFLYTQAGLGYFFPRQQSRGLVSVPVAALLQYQLKQTLGVLGVVAGSGRVGQTRENNLRLLAFGAQLGPGLQWQPSLAFGLTTFYTWSVFGKSSLAYDTFTIGLRTIF